MKCACCNKQIIGYSSCYWGFDVHPECYDEFKKKMTSVNKDNNNDTHE